MAGTWPELLRDHLQRHPEARPQDLYKLVFQGVMGAEHALTDPEAARRALEREMSGLEPDAAEPLIEACDPEGALVRVNLRPYMARGGSGTALGEAFVQSAREIRPDQARLASTLADLDPSGLGPGKAAAGLRAFVRLMAQKDYPPISHSDPYREAYRPAYRVVLARLLPEIGITPAEAPTPAAGP